MEKKCPFGNCQCTPDCALFIAPEDLNELVTARLSSLGVIDRKHGTCSLKTIALASGRYIFENTTTKRL